MSLRSDPLARRAAWTFVGQALSSSSNLLVTSWALTTLSAPAARLPADQRRFVELRGRRSQEELDALFATALFLVQPSLEEGFGRADQS